jgi:signal transduction histidine kinase
MSKRNETPEDEARRKAIAEVKEQLGKELGKKAVDFLRISELAAQLSALDTESAAFSVNATIIRRLGRELMAAQETALAELVKNCYDADGTFVKVTFSATDSPGARLIVEDNGNGMTPEQVRDGFLRIASDFKDREPRSPRFDRRLAGQKGIGRFAVERLGKKLHLITATAADHLATELNVDWASFERSAELFSIRHPIKRVPKTFPQGTMIIIDGLREAWSVDAVQTAESYVSDLTEPTYFKGFLPDIPMERPKRGAEPDPGFGVEFSVLDGVKCTPIATTEASILNSAVATIDGYVDNDGTWQLALNSLRKEIKLPQKIRMRDLSKEDQSKWHWNHLRDVRIRAAYFVHDSDLMEGITLGKLRKRLKLRGGIRLYRNGFRAAPYGEPGDDWLNLDREETKRSILVPLKNTNWLGYVTVTDRTNTLVAETSSREGLVQNEFHEELLKFVRQSLVELAVEVGKARKKKVYASDPDFGQTKSERALKAARSISKYLDDLQKDRASGSGYAKDALTDAALAEIRTEMAKMLKDADELVGEVGILRVFASVGMSMLMFSHEVKGLLASMVDQIDELVESGEMKSGTRKHLVELRGAIGRLQHLTGFYESTGSAAADRTVTGIDVLSMVNGFVEAFRQQAKKRGITLSFEGDPELPLARVAMHEAEFSSILINLYTNAMKAILRHPGAAKREIVLRHSRVGTTEVVEVLDTGTGIKASDKDQIFVPFYTTTPVKRALREGDPEMFGMGLGLSISRDAVRSARGSLEVVLPPPRGFATCMRVELPQISHEQNQVSVS